MSTKTPELVQPLGHLAAEELLRDLRQQAELRAYVLPELWLDDGQLADAIMALNAGMDGICVAVALGEDRLPHGGDVKQGGLLHLGLHVYVFQRADGVPKFDTRRMERVWLTVLHYVGRFRYCPPGKSEPISAILRSIDIIDLREDVDNLQADLVAYRIAAEVPVRV